MRYNRARQSRPNEIVTLHGGEVLVGSAEGAGSTFTICLPRSE
jgi:signal transduction histidine kinase